MSLKLYKKITRRFFAFLKNSSKKIMLVCLLFHFIILKKKSAVLMNQNINIFSNTNQSNEDNLDGFEIDEEFFYINDNIEHEENIFQDNPTQISCCASNCENSSSKNKDESSSNIISNSQNNYDQNSVIFSNYLVTNSTNNHPINAKKLKKKPIFQNHRKWTKDEDEKLLQLIKEFGDNDWRHLAKKFDGRNSRQCRERWNYYLNPDLIQGQWTHEEDDLIISLRNRLGPQWTKISKYFKHRTDAMIKNRYNNLVKRSFIQRKCLMKKTKIKKTVRKSKKLQTNNFFIENEINQKEYYNDDFNWICEGLTSDDFL